MGPATNRIPVKPTGAAGLHGLPIPIIQNIFDQLDPVSRLNLVKTARRFNVAFRSSVTPLPLSPSTHMWDTYAEIAQVKRMILEGEDDEETIKLVLAHKSRGVLARNKIDHRVVFEYRQAIQWKKIEKQMQKALSKARLKALPEVEEAEEVEDVGAAEQRVVKWMEQF